MNCTSNCRMQGDGDEGEPSAGGATQSEAVHPADPAGQLDVAREDGDPLGVDGAQVGVGEQEHEERLGGLEGKRNSKL